MADKTMTLNLTEREMVVLNGLAETPIITSDWSKPLVNMSVAMIPLMSVSGLLNYSKTCCL